MGGGVEGNKSKICHISEPPSKATAREPVGRASRVSGCRVQARRGAARGIRSEQLKVFVKGVTEHRRQQQQQKADA